MQRLLLGLSVGGHKYKSLEVPPEEGMADKHTRSTNTEFKHLKPEVICASWFACPCISSTPQSERFYVVILQEKELILY